MSLHDSLLLALSSVADVKLMASLRDARLGFERDDNIRIFIPDLHLLSAPLREHYRYGTNRVELLAEVVEVIRQLKVTQSGTGKVITYQVGDFLDLWREVPSDSDRIDAANRIAHDHQALVRTLCGPELKARFLLGNHDFNLYRWPNYVGWERRFLLSYEALEKPRGVVLHGDIFDWIEQLPDGINHWAVYYASFWKEASKQKLTEELMVVNQGNQLHDYSQQIAGDTAIGDLLPGPAPSSVPARFNISEQHKFLRSAREACQRLNQAYDLKMRFMVIGHTHQARIALHDEGGDDFFALIDTGAWLENSILPSGTLIQNAQITAICSNEVRIYQLGPK